jgi:hypothetical protein
MQTSTDFRFSDDSAQALLEECDRTVALTEKIIEQSREIRRHVSDTHARLTRK